MSKEFPIGMLDRLYTLLRDEGEDSPYLEALLQEYTISKEDLKSPLWRKLNARLNTKPDRPITFGNGGGKQ